MKPANATDLFNLAAEGNRIALARAISAIERGDQVGAEISRLAYPSSEIGISIGITGSPGAGKSTLTSAIIEVVRSKDQEIAVVAIDPSSPFTGGAILGDRIRTQDHALDDGVYIRSMATRGHLGGLTVAVPEAVRLLSAVGFATTIVETVGVGQIEIDIVNEADTTVVVVNPGWGDSIQANKAGLMEIADVFIINKADRAGTRETRRDLESMLDLSAPKEFRPPIIETVASEKKGVEEAYEAILSHRIWADRSGLTATRRRRRRRNEVERIVRATIEAKVAKLVRDGEVDGSFERLDNLTIDPHTLARTLLDEANLQAERLAI